MDTPNKLVKPDLIKLHKSVIVRLSALVAFIFVAFALCALFMIRTIDDYFLTHIEVIKKTTLENKKALAKERIENIIQAIDMQRTVDIHEPEIQKQNIIDEFKNWYFGANENEYLFIYRLENAQDTFFATMLVNPNRPDLVGEKISLETPDAEGKMFRKEMLQKLLNEGEAFVSYVYKTPQSDESENKLSYFKYYPEWQWIVATGIYLKDMEKDYSNEIESANDMTRLLTQVVTVVFIVMAVFASLIMYLAIRVQKEIASRQIEYFQNYNDILKTEVEAEVNKNLKLIEEKERNKAFMHQQAKMAEMGNMINAITHQWKQPLNVLSLLRQAVEDIIGDRERIPINDNDVQRYMEQSKSQIEFMSQTITDFRNFLNPSKEKERFLMCESVAKVYTMFKNVYANKGVEILIKDHKHFYAYGYPSEFMHVVLIVLNNARDAILEKNKGGGVIECDFETTDTMGIIYIRDEGGGINPEVMEKLFKSQITTKGEQGTGIGLRLARDIMEKNMDGEISVKNTPKGAEFTLKLPLAN